MRTLVKKREVGQIEFGLIYGGIAVLVLCVARSLPMLSILPSCAFKGLTGIPCPTCGATRSVIYLVHADIAASFAINPLISLCFIAAVGYFFYSAVTLAFGIPRVCFSLTEREKNAMRAGAGTIALVNWIYLIFTL